MAVTAQKETSKRRTSSRNFGSKSEKVRLTVGKARKARRARSNIILERVPPNPPSRPKPPKPPPPLKPSKKQ